MDTEQEIPQVIQNSDYLYKSDVKWVSDIEYIEPNEYEKDMLKDTKTPAELIEEEQKEVVEEQTEEEKKKGVITMIKVIALNRMNLYPLFNASNLQPLQKQTLMGIMECLVQLWNDGDHESIANEFNTICNEKLFANSVDVSTHPVYKNV
jgi:hypothetical protein